MTHTFAYTGGGETERQPALHNRGTAAFEQLPCAIDTRRIRCVETLGSVSRFRLPRFLEWSAREPRACFSDGIEAGSIYCSGLCRACPLWLAGVQPE